MKHILPIITITTLAAAASAQSAASSGLSYNSVSATYVRNSQKVGGHTTDYVIGAQALIGSSNFLVSGAAVVGGTDGNRGAEAASLGYVFKNVQGLADVTVSVSSSDIYVVNVRKALASGFEVAASYERNNGESTDIYGLAVGYTFNKVYTLDLGWNHASANSANSLSAGLRYNF